MPHITIEYSENIFEKDRMTPILKETQALLQEPLKAKPTSFEGHAIGYKDYTVREGTPDNAFVHVNVKLLTGRSRETLDHVMDLLGDFLKSAFHETLQKKKLSLTVELQELSPTYKVIN